MRDLATACSLALVIEGVAYALFPGAMQRMVAAVLTMPLTPCGVLASSPPPWVWPEFGLPVLP